MNDSGEHGRASAGGLSPPERASSREADPVQTQHADLARALCGAGVRSVHVEAGPQGASVLLAVDGSDLVTSCTCGAPSPCVHARAALGALGVQTAGADEGLTPTETASPRTDTRTACANVCTAAVATGLDPSAPALVEALATLAQALATDYRPQARRAHGRLVDALAERDVRKAAQSLVELATVARLVGDAEHRSEVSLLEVGRDTGTDALGRWDETIFLDLARGELLVEGAPMAVGRKVQMSEGPFPRLLVGQLIDVEPGRPPRRVRLIQYEPRGVPGAADIDRLVGHALADVEAIRAAAATGTALLLARAARLGTLAGEPALVDDRGRAIPLARGARALTAALLHVVAGSKLRAVLGRVGLAEQGHLEIRPLAAVVGHRIVRLA